MATGIFDATATVVTPSAGALAADNNLRVASLTIAAYDYLLTLPAEYRLYKSSNRRSTGLMLFVILRYSSIMVLIISNVGFFYHGFTSKTCDHYYMVTPVFKGTGSVYATSALVTDRSDSGPNDDVPSNPGYSDVWYFPAHSMGRLDPSIVIYSGCWVSMVFLSICPDSFDDRPMLFDCLTLSISTFYLIKVKAVTSGTSQLCKILLYDGIGYFVALTLTNAANIMLYRGVHHTLRYRVGPSASFEYAVTWIMSQRILIHPRSARTDQTSVVLSQLPSSRAVTSALRFDKGSKHPTNVEQGDSPEDECGNTESDFDLQVRIDKSVVVDARAQDECSKDKDLFWDRV
ncbi:hypothetical protein H4582DRAFT_2169925 [Lactarius indigo]|nr:hypothetical protein H4582DRAFT_2169925 [Lactarius indigo]